MAKSYSAKGHKLYTIATRGGVVAECQGEGCTWSGTHIEKVPKHNIKALRTMSPEDRAKITPENAYTEREVSVFPRRELAVESHNAFHRAREQSGE